MPELLLIGAAVLVYLYFQQSGAQVDNPDDVEGSNAGDTADADVGSVLGAAAGTVAGYVNGIESDITVSPIGNGYVLRSDAAASFNRLNALAQQQGVLLQIDDAFRSMEEQTRLWNLKQAGQLSQLVAVPGHSNHQGGVALDIAVQSSNVSPVYLWLSTNATPFGWTNVGAGFSKPEFWHWEYNPNLDNYA